MTQGYIFDIDGTLIFDGAPLPDAIETINALREQDKTLRFATNGTGKSKEEIADELNAFGFKMDANEVETSVTACIRYLKRNFPTSKGQLLLPTRTYRMFEDFECDNDDPAYIVLGDLDEKFNYLLLNDVFQKMKSGVPLIVFHRNTQYRKNQTYHLDSGAFTLALENATGEIATVMGKPSMIFFQEICHTMDLPKEQILIIGDDVSTDIKGGIDAGISTALVKTGKYRANPRNEIKPTRVLDNLKDLL
jgi:HAD superfamily hydrolase (TIGR01458 family)